MRHKNRFLAIGLFFLLSLLFILGFSFSVNDVEIKAQKKQIVLDKNLNAQR